jgi:hypothetical protein
MQELGNCPFVPEGVAAPAIKLAPKHLLKRHEGFRAGSKSATPNGCSIADLQMKRYRCRCLCWQMRSVARVKLREVIHKHDGRAFDEHTEMQIALTTRSHYPSNFASFECLLIEDECSRRILNSKDGSHSHWGATVILLLRHYSSISAYSIRREEETNHGPH